MNVMTSNAEEKALVETAKRVMPAGGFGNIASEVVLREGKGGRVWDVSGNEYVDFLLGSGPMFIGHAHPEVNAAVIEQVGRGSTFFANNEHGIELAAAIVDAVPCAEQVRFACTGTEADAYAMRLVRAYRKRSKILKFEGGYHGMSDYSLLSMWAPRPGNTPEAAFDSAGIPESVKGEMLISTYNDLAAAEQLIHAHKDELAGVIVEPMQRLIPPVPGFLEGLRAITAEYGIPLIFDEVVTGFRLAYGGGQEYFGVTPDLCTMGKIVGGGYPLSAIAGKAELMAHFDVAKVGAGGFTPQIGTLSGNPVAAIAGLATLKVLKRPGAYEKVFASGKAIWQAMEVALKEAGHKVTMLGLPVMFDAMFTDRTTITEHRGTMDVDKAKSRRFNQLVRERGVFKSDNKLYMSVAHDEKDVADTIKAFQDSAKLL